MTRCFCAALAALLIYISSIAASANTDNRLAMIDSLETRLQYINTSQDSLATLFDILDLSIGREKKHAVERVYHAAVNAHDTIAQLEAIMYSANQHRDNIEFLEKLEERISQYPPSPRAGEIALFIDLLQIENEIKADTTDFDNSKISALIQDYSTSPPDNKYEQMKLLYAVCTQLARCTGGDLLQKYTAKLCRLAETADFPIGAVRNLIYTRAAPVFTNNSNPRLAVEIDKKTLNIIDSLVTSYNARGRKFRKLETNRYTCYRRMLGNYKALSRAEIEQYHNAILSLAAKNSQVKANYENGHRSKLFYAMATGNYPQAIKEIRLGIDQNENKEYRDYFLNALFEAAEKTGDKATQLDAAVELNKILRSKIEDKTLERYRELQIIYDVNELQNINAELLNSRHQAELRTNRIIIIISAIALLLLLAMTIVLWRQNVRMKKLTKELGDTASRLRRERNDLQNAQKELIDARDKAKRADKLKADFINNMSHEVKTPLAAISEYSRLIIDCIPDSKRNYLDRFADIIDRKTKLILTLMNDVLDIASLEHGNMSISPAPNSVIDMCTLALDNVFEKEKSAKPGVTVLFNTSHRPDTTVVTDSQRVVQVLINLLSNAEKFTESGSITLDFFANEEAGTLTFAVTDTGIGIPDSQRDTIFDRFKQLDSSADGCGLGLYISRLIAKLLGGSLRVDPDYHKGARFLFVIPL